MDKKQENRDIKKEIVENEKKILNFWRHENIFLKSQEESINNDFVFYDGPPFATGLPHYGHILPGTLKDAIPRFQVMNGKSVRRKWGWDCHGLPIENIIEKELNLKTKKDIEGYGIDNFNEKARSRVLTYAEDWRNIIPRTGRWVDMDDDYKTMDSDYTESVWWSFKELYKKDLVYKGFKSMHLCPRCETTLSNFEVSQGYTDITDISIIAKFKLKNEDNTFILAWTTTPWTLPGNAALAINPKIEYVKVEQENEFYILAEKRLESIKGDYKIIEKFKGIDLLGKEYESVFEYYKKENIKNGENLWKIYGADFVSTEDGTGIVHIAPAFGSDDLNLSFKENIPMLVHVGRDGKFKEEISDFEGFSVKPKGDHQSSDILIIKNLAGRNLLYSKEKIIHSYPHCWRCDTPLLNYASDSWFVRVSSIKNKIIEENKKVNWVPKDIRDGRFGKWLEGAPDWAISRSRFWGAPIPVWQCLRCDKFEFVGSIEELKEKSVKKNNYFLLRHGEALNNKLNVLSSSPDHPHNLTENGREQVTKVLNELKDKKIDIIFHSPFVRTKETAEIIFKELKLPDISIFSDNRLSELDFGELNTQPVEEYSKLFNSVEERFYKKPEGGENLSDVKKRIGDFMEDINSKYSGKNILIVSHDSVLWILHSISLGLTEKESANNKNGQFMKNAQLKEINFGTIPLNKEYKLDVHRPYIDKIKLKCSCGSEMERVSEVFDCWYESGSMPFASVHYPFENKNIFDPQKDIGFPADFIAESVDQTRGWFYSLLVLSVGLFNRSPYKNVIVGGMILAEDGKKMSKRLKNYPDLLDIIDKYGADSLRFYILSSPVVRSESLNFSEKGVDEVSKKILMRLYNVFLFYKIYSGKNDNSPLWSSSENILDIWIVSRLNEVIREVTKSMNSYETDRATKPINEFLDDLSTWYLRRSRDRFKSDDVKDKEYALKTTAFILFELSKIMAPFTPFISETLYQELKCGNSEKSIHLEKWPRENLIENIDQEKVLNDMILARKIVSLGLDNRIKLGIKVRQPLSEIVVKDSSLKGQDDYLSIISQELNVKNVSFNENIKNDVELNTEITPSLKEEGLVREIIRKIQEFRKGQEMSPSEWISINVSSDEKSRKFLEKNLEVIKKATFIESISFEDFQGESISVEDISFTLRVK